MWFTIDGEMTTVWPDSFYGGRHERGVYEYLYRLPSGRWFLHTVSMGPLAASLVVIPEQEAIDWLIRSRRIEESWTPEKPQQVSARMVPDWVVPREDMFQGARHQYCCPPPVGNHVVIEVARISRTWDAIVQRQSQFLEPGRVLEHIMWPAAADAALTARFEEQRHDPMVAQLCRILEARLVERPHLSILQSLQDRGCDLLIEWPGRQKYGVQLKSNGDVEQDDFSNKTLAQIQDSRQHGLTKLFVVLAADITGNANSQRVRGMVSRISSMNDSYVAAVPPERAWTLLFPT